MRNMMRGLLLVGVTVLSTSAAFGASPTLSFHRASASASKGLRQTTMPSGEVLYVATRATWTTLDVVSAERTSDGTVEITFSGDVARRLLNLSQRSDARVAVKLDGRLASSGTIDGDGRVTFGDLSAEQITRVTRLSNAEPITLAGAVVTVVPAGSSKDHHFVDVFVHGVSGLRSYQTTLVVGGGESGRLELTQVTIDKDRADYVFGDSEIVQATSPISARLAAVRYTGTVDVGEPAYLGTYTFVSSPDASGTFRVNVQVGSDSLLVDDDSELISFSIGADAKILLGSPSRRDDR